MAKEDRVTYSFKKPAHTAFVNIVKPKAFEEKGKAKGEPRYSATFILDPSDEDLTALKAAVVDMAKSLAPGKKLVTRRLTQEELDAGNVVEVSVPWKDGTKLADKAKADGKDQEFYRGKIVVKAASKYAPVISVVEGGKIVERNDPEMRPTMEKFFYSGAYLGPMVELHSYPAKDEKPAGVSLWLSAACFVKHGKKTSGGSFVNSVEAFKGYVGQETAEDPTGGELDDEIPF